eukprot:135818_1
MSNSQCSNEITKELVHKLHDEQLMNGENNKNNTQEILNIFGGIDAVISTYLKTNDVSLSYHQLQQIHKILSIRAKNRTKMVYNENIKNIHASEDRKTHFGDLVYTFDVNNTFLNALFGHQNGNKIKNILTHKITMILLMLSGIIGTVFFTTLTVYFIPIFIFDVYYIALSCCFWIPLLMFLILSFNKLSCKYIFFSFDFWIKAGYCIVLQSCVCIYEFHLGVSTLTSIRNIVSVIVVVLAIIFISSLDAVQMAPKWKGRITLLGAVLFTFFGINYQFFVSPKDDYIINIKATNSSISFQSLLSSSCRIIAIFMWKQGIRAFRRKQKSISITYTPYIEWKEILHENIYRENEYVNEYLNTHLDENLSEIEIAQVQQMNIGAKGNNESVSPPPPDKT